MGAPYDGLARFRATANVALWLCDEMARAGREEGDAPRLLAQAAVHWTEDKDTRALTRARKVFDEWQKPIWPPPRSEPYDKESHIRWRWVRAISFVVDSRAELVKRARVGANLYEFSLCRAADLLVATGEDPDASALMVCVTYDGFIGYEMPDSARVCVRRSARDEAKNIREWKALRSIGKSSV